MNKAPTSVMIGGVNTPIKTDFSTCMQFEKLIMDSGISDNQKLNKALKLFYGNKKFSANELSDAVDGILYIYTCGNNSEQSAKKGEKTGCSMNRIYDYEHDADYIYAAFKQQYGEDLQKNHDMHWWAFKSMFKSLSDNTEFVKIMGYRAITISKDMTKSQKEFYTKMKRIHSLPLPADEQKKLDAIEQALLNGGDLTGIINV